MSANIGNAMHGWMADHAARHGVPLHPTISRRRLLFQGELMKQILRTVAAVLFIAVLHPACMAADRGTAEEAAALIKKAVAYLNANGQDKAAVAFNNPKGEFVNRDLYVWAADLNTGIAWAHGVNPKFVGQNLYQMTDNTGKHFITDLFNAVKAKGRGSVDYQWPNPVTKSIETKTTYAEKVGNNVIACGIYK